MATARKKSIWIGEPILQLIASRRAHDDDAVNVSGILNRTVERYQQIITAHLPRLRWQEWCAIFDALNGVWINDHWSPRYTALEVQDAEGLGEKWGIDQPALVATLQAMDMATGMAVLDATERFWASEAQPGADGWRGLVAAIVGDKALAD